MNADELAKLLDELGQRLGPTGQHVFELTVRQVLIESLIGVGVGIAVVVITAIAIRPIVRYVQAGESYGDRGMAAMIGGLLWAFVLVFAMVNALFFALPALLNPEYAALVRIISTVKP